MNFKNKNTDERRKGVGCVWGKKQNEDNVQ
jgi:hypothetical protein